MILPLLLRVCQHRVVYVVQGYFPQPPHYPHLFVSGHFLRTLGRLAQNLNLAAVQWIIKEYLFAQFLLKLGEHPRHHRIVLPVYQEVFNHLLRDSLHKFLAPGLP